MIKTFKNQKLWPWLPNAILFGLTSAFLIFLAIQSTEKIKIHWQNYTGFYKEIGENVIDSYKMRIEQSLRHSAQKGASFQSVIDDLMKKSRVLYLVVINSSGKIVAHSKTNQVGKRYGDPTKLKSLKSSTDIEWKQYQDRNKKVVFEVSKRITIRNQASKQIDDEQYVIVGLDYSPIMLLMDKVDRFTGSMIVVFISIICIWIFFFLIGRTYFKTRSSLDRMTVFSSTLVENIPVGLLTIDRHGKIGSVNHVAETLLGLPEASSIGQKAQENLPSIFSDMLEELKSNNTIIGRELICMIDGEHSIPLDISAAVLKDEGQGHPGYMFLFKDLTDVYDLRKKISHDQRLVSIGKLAAGVAHEIRNPLSSITGFAAYFREEYSDKKKDKEIANIMIQEVDRVDRVVRQLLEFAKPEKPIFILASLSTLIEDILKLLSQQLKEKEIEVKLNIGDTIPKFKLDVDRMSQAILNLCLNAVETIEENGNLEIDVRVDHTSDCVQIKVSDTGCGISEETLPLIFDPYFTTKQSGSGIGLANVHQIIEAHKGKIEVKSSAGIGSSFIITLPLKPNPDKRDKSLKSIFHQKNAENNL